MSIARASVFFALVTSAFVTSTAVAQLCNPKEELFCGEPTVAVTPDGNAFGAYQYTQGNQVVFTVQNIWSATNGYSLSCSQTGNITNCSPSQTFVTLGSGQSTQITVTFETGAPGSGSKVWLHAAPEGPGEGDDGYYNVSIAVGPPPALDVTQFHPRRVDYGMCLNACGAATYAQSTVPYFSLDTPRSVTLVYNEDRTSLKPFVFADVSHSNPNYPPTKYQLQVKVNGAFVTFLNGETTLNFSYPGLAAHRIAGQFEASSYATGVYSMDIIVTSVFPTGSVSSTANSHLVVLDERNSPIARGWSVAGVQRLYVQADGSMLIAEGDGGYSHFLKNGSTFTSPTGDFSRLYQSGPAYWRTYPDSTRVDYNSAGLMTQIADRFGNGTQFQYDGSNRLQYIDDPAQKTITLSYGAYGLSSVKDHYNRYTYVTVQSDGRLTTITDPDNVSTAFGYDGSKRLSTITSRNGATTTLTYDSQSGKLASVVAPAVAIHGQGTQSPTTTFDRWQKDGVPYGSTSTPFAPVLPDSVDEVVTEPGGQQIRFRRFERHGQPFFTHLPLGLVDTTYFNEQGLLTSHIGPTHARTSRSYDGTGLLTHFWIDNGSNDIDIWRRNGGWGQADSVWGDQGVQRLFLNSSNGRVDSAFSGDISHMTRVTYDGQGRVLTATDPEGHLVRRSWYSGTNGNTSKDSLPGGRVTTYGYDTYGRETTVVAPDQPTRTTHYDVLNRPDWVDDGVNPLTTRFGYDNLFLTSVTDPKNQVYQYTHNALGWQTQYTDPAGRSTTSEYSIDGDLREWTNRRDQAINYTYDALHRRRGKSGTNVLRDSIAYSNDGRTVVMYSRIYSSTLLSVDTTFLNDRFQPDSVVTNRVYYAAYGSNRVVLRHAYADNGLLDSVWATGGPGNLTRRQYSYTPSSLLAGIRFGTAWTTLNRNDDFQVGALRLPGDTINLDDIATIHRPSRLTSAGMDNKYYYDDLVRTTRYWSTANKQRIFSYDSLGRVADTDFESGADFCMGWQADNGYFCYNGTVDSTHAFSYDDAGNRLDMGGSYTNNRISAFDGCSYLTDYDGNVTRRTCGGQVVDFTWTADNRLETIVINGTTSNFRYDPAGRLIRQWGGQILDRNFIWNGSQLFAGLNWKLTTKEEEYSWYPGLDNLHAVWASSNNTTHYAHTDALGNVVALTDPSGAIKRTYVYDEWGSLVAGADFGISGKNRSRFKGALMLGPDGVEVYYMRNRWYEPKTGRFLSEDPIGLQGGINPYTFAGNDPINGRDPTGLEPCWDLWQRMTKWVDGKLVDTWWEYRGRVCYEEQDEGNHGGGNSSHQGRGGQQAPGTASYTAVPQCPALNNTFLRQLDQEFRAAQAQGRERGGWYGAPWTNPLRHTTVGGTDFIRVPRHPGAAGHYHTHQNPPTTHYQGPSTADSIYAVNVLRSPDVIPSQDSLFIIYPNGSIVGCAR